MNAISAQQIARLSPADSSEYVIVRPKVGVTIYNEPYFWNPIDNGTYSARGNNRIRFDIPNSDIWNFQIAWLAVDLTITTDGIPVDLNPAYQRMSNGIWNAIERVRHLSNLAPIEEIYPYWNIYSYQWVFEQNEMIEQTFGTQFGVATQAERNAWGLITKRFILPLDLGWIGAGPFPAKLLNATHSIELFLIPPNQFVETNCGNVNFTFSNMELHAYKLSSKFPGVVNEIRGTSWEEGFTRMVRAGQYEVMLDYWDWYQNNNLTVQGDYLIPVKTAAIQGIFSVFGNVNTLADTLVNDRQMTFPKHDINQFQLKIFSKLFPEQPVDCRDDAFQAYQFYLNSVNGWFVSGFPAVDPTSPDAINEAPIKIAEFNNEAWSMVFDFRSIRKVPSINPIFNSDVYTGDIRLTLRFNVAPPAGTCIYHLVRSSSIFRVTPNGDVEVQLN